MDLLNINTIVDGEPVHANYRLRREPVKLNVKYVAVGGLGADRWEDDGGALAPPPYEETVCERHRAQVRQNPGRKQIAARRAIPRESITVVPVLEPVKYEEAVAIVEDKTVEQVKIDVLEVKIRELMGLVQRRRSAEQLLDAAIEGLGKRFEERRVK